MKLVIVESPAKCKKIQGFLGKGWKVVASMGHIRRLLPNLDFIKTMEPSYEWMKEKSKTIKDLKEINKEAMEVYLAADKDWEGEQIAYSVCLLLRCDPKTTKRITFSEITEKAIQYAIAHPSIIDMNRVHTQQCRAMLDLLIGFTMSPLLWRKVAPSLSAGRCQIPALRLVVEREEQIKEFQSEASWRLEGIWKALRLPCFIFSAQMEDELEDEESVKNYMEQVQCNGTVTHKHIKKWTEKPPLPFITSTLQQQASTTFHMNPKQTMKTAQSLYEQGHITYMRTDQPFLSEEATVEACKWIESNYGKEFVALQPKKNDTKTHEAIRPTHIDVLNVDGVYENKLYQMIWKRTIQSVMSQAQGEYCEVKIDLDDFLWCSHAKRTLFEGWKRGQEEKSEWDIATLEVGDKVEWTAMKGEPVETKAKGRFTEAMLISQLEKKGIGRPSTFASLMATIEERNYVEKTTIQAKEQQITEYHMKPLQKVIAKQVIKRMGGEKNVLVPTQLGISVLQCMLEHFPDLFAYEFTSHMETKLDEIAEGKEWKGLLQNTWDSYRERYEKVMSEPKLTTTKTQKIQLGYLNEKPVEKKTGRFGDYVEWNKVTIPFMEESFEETIRRLEQKQIVKEQPKMTYIIRDGKYGPYIIKTSVKKSKFVSVPKGVDSTKLTKEEIKVIYELGVKTSPKQYKSDSTM